MIFLTNSLTKQKKEFRPIDSGNVRMYHCGPTVYDYIHIGNLRAFVTADIIRRTFEFNKYEVTQVINITDVGIGGDNDEGEDKMTKGLKREGKPITIEAMKELGDFYTERFKEETAKLNILTPHFLPKASEHISEDIDLIKTLKEKGFTYTAKNGVYFDTSKDSHYGKLGGIAKDDESAQARISVNASKKNPRDFALWKLNSLIGYESPWGKGFPGWHIECSAMSRKYLGEHFDIHTGGIDLSSIHHNNEIAQSENACACDFVNYWLHNEMVNVEAGKMAKSEGTGIRLQTIIDRGLSPLAYRYWLLTAHYRSPVAFSWETLEGAEQAYYRLQRNFLSLGSEIGTVHEVSQKRFTEFINDDLNTPKALALVWDILGDAEIPNADKKATLLDFDKVLGLKLDAFTAVEIPAGVRKLVTEREAARQKKDWKKADELRDDILKNGFIVKDLDSGPELYPAKSTA